MKPRTPAALHRTLHAFALALALGAPLALRADYTLNFTRTPDNYVSTTGKITTTTFTVEMWFRQPSFDDENQLLVQDTGGTGRLILTTKYGTNSFQVGNNNFRGNSNLLANTWHHVAFVRDGSGNGTIYLNGNVDRSATLNTQPIDNSTLIIGLLNRVKKNFRGQIADVRVWNTVRSQAQIKANYNIRLAGTESGLIHYWPLNEGSGATALNRASNAHGTIVAATWANSPELPILASTSEMAWNVPTGGNWSEGANWLNLAPAQGTDSIAYFTNRPPTPVSINNDMAGLLLGRILVSGPNGHTFTGNAIALTNQFVTAQLSSTNGSHAFETDLTFTFRGLSLETLAPAALAVSGVLSGAGNVSLNPAATGGGSITLSGANTYSGSTTLGSGQLSVNTVGNGGAASVIGSSSAAAGSLTLGPATLRFTGATASTDRGYTVNAPNKAMVLRVEAGGDLTFGGQIQTTSGGQVKTGPGTVRYTYPGLNRFSTVSQNDAILNIGANGDGPSQGFYSYGVAEGRVIFDAADQTNEVNGRLCVGLYTTTNANAETDAELILNNGVINTMGNTFGVGRSHGTRITAPAGASSVLTVNGGTLLAGVLSVGYNGALNIANFNARQTITQTGGAIIIPQYVSLAESPGAWTALNVSGGRLSVTNNTANANAINVGMSGTAGAREAIVTLSGTGEVDLLTDINLAMQSAVTGTLYLAGGTLTARNIVRSNGSGTLFFNGGTFRPRTAGQTLQGLTAAYVSTNGAAFDAALAEYTVNQNLLHDPNLSSADGGLVKLGTNSLVLASTGSTYSGTTVVNGGTLRVTGALPPAAEVTVAPGAFLSAGGSATQTVSAASVTLNGNGGLAFSFRPDGSANDRLSVASSPALGTGRIALFQANTDIPFTGNGTYTLITYAGADPAVSGLTIANPVYGKTYSLAAGSGAVTVTIGLDAAASSIWNVDAGGDWATGSNWTVPPASAAGSHARFDTVISSPVTITNAGETAGALFFNSLRTYTLAGSTGLTLDNAGAPASVTVESGSHTLAAPLTLAGDTDLYIAPFSCLNLGPSSGSVTLTAQGNGTLALMAAPAVASLRLNVPELTLSNALNVTAPVELLRTVAVRPASNTASTLSGVVSGSSGLNKAGSSTLTLSAANTYTGVTRVDAGTLTATALANGGAACSLGAAPAAAANLVIGPATLRYAGSPATVNRAYTVASGGNTRAAVLRADGDLTFSGQIASSSGCFVKTGPGTVRYTYAGPQTLSSLDGPTPDAVQNIGANGDGPTIGFSGYTVNNGKVVFGVTGQTNTINGRLTVGICTTTNMLAETAGELEINAGSFTCDSTVGIGRGNGNAVTAGPTGLSSRLTVNGGAVTFRLLALGFCNISGYTGYNGRPVCDLNGGSVTVSTYCNIGESVGSYANLNVNGGTLRVSGQNGGNGISVGLSGTGFLTLSGTGTVDSVFNVTLGTASTGKGTLTLNGGMLIASNVVKSSSSSEATLRFNGGVFRPRATGMTLGGLNAAIVSTNGAVIDTSLTSYTVAQRLTHDTNLASLADGGLTKQGTNTLTVTGTNTFSGPITVQAGLLRARVSSTNDLLVVTTNAFFDALGLRATVRDLSGSGMLTNGVIAVTGTLNAGTNGAPAGARMTVQNLSLVKGVTFACDWSTNALGQVTNDFVTVAGVLSAEGPGFVDFERTATNPIPVPFQATIMSYGTLTGSFAGWKAINTGLDGNAHPALLITADSGLVRIEVVYGGTLLMLR